MTGDKITVVDTEFYTAWCFPEKRLIQHQWHRYCSGEDFRESMAKVVSAFEQYNCYKWLSDDREFLGAVAHEDWQWCDTEFLGHGIWERWKYSAIVMPEALLAKISLQSLVGYFASKGVEAMYFSDFNEAETWIGEK